MAVVSEYTTDRGVHIRYADDAFAGRSPEQVERAREEIRRTAWRIHEAEVLRERERRSDEEKRAAAAGGGERQHGFSEAAPLAGPGEAGPGMANAARWTIAPYRGTAGDRKGRPYKGNERK